MKRSWTDDQLIQAVKTCTSHRQVLKHLNLIPAGGNYAQIQKHIARLKLDTGHFLGRAWNKGKNITCNPGKSLEEIMTKASTYSTYKLKRRLLRVGLKPSSCEECGWAKQSQEGHLPLELDHINGDRFDHRLENLRILCPNCHSLKPTYRGHNIKLKRKRASGETGRHETLKPS